MNKIFKVVWSKVKHCYVVVSEVAKNVINGSVKSAKISGTPMTRGLALGAMMAFVITGNAWADGESKYKIFKLPSNTITNPTFDSNDEFMNGNSFLKYLGGGWRSYYFYYPKDSFNYNILRTSGVINYEVEKAFSPFAGFSNIVNETDIGYNNLIVLHDIISKNAMEISGAYKAGKDANDNTSYKIHNNRVLINIREDKVLQETLKKIIDNEVLSDTVKIESLNSYILISGGFANDNARNSLVENNEVRIDNTVFSASTILIYGGYAKYGEVDNNVVEINNCILPSNSNIYGGYAQYKGDVTNNIVNISNVELQGASLYGGISGNGIVSNNILNIKEKINGSAYLVSNFSTINFSNLHWQANDTVITTENLELDSSGSVKVNVKGLTKDSTPKKGEVMTLLDTDNVVPKIALVDGKYLDESTSNFKSGSFLKAEGKIYQDDKDIKLKITRVGTNDQALVIGESRAAATAFTNQGSELIESGIDSLARDKTEKEIKVIASVFGNTSEYATGSHVKVNGWSGIVGVAKTNDDGLTAGAFFENGEGNYRTFNTFEGDFMRGDGEANYNGGGFLVRKDNSNGVYTEASLRAGNMRNELRKAVIADNKLEGYDINTFYYGAHIGVGKIIPRGNEGDSIDVYGKFIYTHHDSEDFAVGRDNFHFDSIDSERLRLGFRINEVQNDKLSMYYGAAWEYEFNGDANNTVVGYDISTPSLGGSTVIGEIGAHYKANEKWTFDANLRGYSGQRDGFTGSIQANYLF